MYTRFWGFREKPFRQVPNPAFLFLSQTHEEALAHLNYALAEGEGFLMVTGEVGTGKSTLCRSFFEKLDADTAYAYIFNSKLDPLQLLRSINAEFGIAADADTPQDLIDTLNAFLIDKRAAGHKVVIVIDEAQNLPVDSLEQVRLLSNLETTQEKLLHLVLVGQPELADMIDSFALRQLGQRIHLACHLQPLSFDETIQYIQHRINLVSEKPQMPFEKGALRAIFAFSKGVPRLVNAACDRMLLSAYLKNRSRISTGMASKIIEELQHRGRPREPAVSWTKVAIGVSLFLVIAASALFLILEGPLPYLSAKVSQHQNAAPEVDAPDPPLEIATQSTLPEALNEVAAKTQPDTAPTLSKPDPWVDTSPKIDPQSQVAMPLDQWLRSIQSQDTRRLALEAVLRQWNLDPQGDMVMPGLGDGAFFDGVAERHGLSILTVNNGIDYLVALDLPAVILLRVPRFDPPLYAGLVGVTDEGRFELKIHGQESPVRLDALTLMRLWGGSAFVLWKNYMGYPGVIPGGAPRPAIVLLKQLLWEIGYSDIVIDDRYDDITRQAVMEIQAKHGLEMDGLVGSMTKIALFNEKRSLPMPHLRKSMPADGGTE